MVEKKFKVNGVKLKLVDGKDLYYWYDTWRGKLMKNPYWKLKKLHISNNGYSATGINGKIYLFHRLIFKAFNKWWNIEDNSQNNSIDHIDRNKLNNNINNLRVVNHSQNQINSHRSQYSKGYSYRKDNNTYQASIRLNGKTIHLKYFKTKKEAFLKAQKVKRFVNVLKIIYKNKNI